MNYPNPLRKQSFRLATRARLGAAAVAACFMAAPALSNPVNPTVVNGSATFNQAGSVLTVTNSNGAIINWDKFSIKAGETTRFEQASASSSVLNRVLNDPTAIYGTLSSNGRVWLVNPAGIMVGAGGRVDVAGFVASTLNISNENFLAGRKLFENTSGAGNVVNQGEIRTPAGGSVYLIGSNVSNEGIITTPQGETILAAGATVSLIDSATPGVKVDITGAEGNATNLGEITAEAGRIGIAGVIVRNSGLLNASSVVNEGGRIFLKASQDAYVDGNGRIVTTGTKGGSVEVLGNRVAVMDHASIDASATSEGGDGGSIKIGGDYQGKNPDIQNATITYFGADAELKADAGKVGDGGTVIVWADDTTRAYGDISARGGAAGGNGGFVETSGKRYLDVAGISVNTGAALGDAGHWLLDPMNLSIVSGSGGQTISYGGTPSIFGAAAETTSTIYAGDISTALGFGNVDIQSGNGTYGGNITFSSGTISWSTAYGLGIYASAKESGFGNVTFNSGTSISGSNASSYLKVYAGWNGVAITGADTDSSSSATAKLAGSISTGSSVTIYSPGDIIAPGSISSGTVTLRGGATSYGGSTAGGKVTLGSMSGSSSVSVTAYGGIYDDNGTGTANITTSGTATLTSKGGKSGDLAISADIASASTINATVTGSYGGIRIDYLGNITSSNSVTVSDTSSYGNSSKGIRFNTTGDMYLGSEKSFTSSANWIGFYAGGTLGYNGASISTPTTEGFDLIAGKTVNVDSAISTSEIGIAAGWTKAQLQAVDNVNITSAQQLLSYLGTGGTVNINQNVTASTKDVAMLANDININGAQVRANSSTGKAYLAAGNNIKLSNGALVYAGDDVYLALAGSTSAIYLNEFTGQSASKIHAGSPNTVNLYFAGLSSGGIVINGVATSTTVAGGSGFYVGSTATPALPGAGLQITYATLIQLDPVTTNLSGAVDKVDSTTTPTEDPTSPTTETADTAETATWTTATGETILLSGYTTGGTEDETFGAISTAAGTTASTEEEKKAATEEPPPTSTGKGRSGGQKKVAQCSS